MAFGRNKWWEPQDLSETDFPPDQTVTHINPFRDHPRWDREKELSIVEGALSVFEAVRCQFHRTPKKSDRVRHIEVVDLRTHGYRAYAAPLEDNPRHGSISAPLPLDSPTDEHQHWWDNAERVLISEFAKIMPKDGKS